MNQPLRKRLEQLVKPTSYRPQQPEEEGWAGSGTVAMELGFRLGVWDCWNLPWGWGSRDLGVRTWVLQTEAWLWGGRTPFPASCCPFSSPSPPGSGSRIEGSQFRK
jgi:hypothetical protein